jgi:NDP-sugar pyrophosphorylase family protein
MRAVILAGGQGTRLRPYTTVLPKPLVPVGDRPVLELILHRLATCGFVEVDLCIGHLGELITAYFADGSRIPDRMSLRYHREDEPLGTAGALRGIEHLDETFVAMNGDIVTDLDFRDLVSFHRANDAALTIATTKKQVPIPLGVIEHEGERVTGYVEKPTLGYSVSMGVYVYEPRVLELLPSGHVDFPDVVRLLLERGESVVSYPFSGTWFDIGTPEDHERAVSAFGVAEEQQ